MHMDLSMECLSVSEEITPPLILVPTGDGEDGKSLRTILRGNVLGDAHKVMSPKCFQVEDELRKQGNQFAFARGVTIPECMPGAPLIEDEFKSFAGNGKVACRPLFGKTTVYYQWERCGKWWEMNKSYPSIRAAQKDARRLRAFVRRFRVIVYSSSFTLDADSVDFDKKVFMDDPTLAEFLGSPEARHIYLHKVLLPYRQHHTAAECVRTLKQATPRIMQDTLAMVQQMANGGIHPYVEGAAAAAAEAVKEIEVATAAKIQRDAHIATAGLTFVNSNNTYRMKDGPGTWSKTVKKKKNAESKMDCFVRTRLQWPYYFGQQNASKTFPRLNIDVPRFEDVLQEFPNSATVFGGSFADWGNTFALKDQIANVKGVEPTEFWQEELNDPNVDEDAGYLTETINYTCLADKADGTQNPAVLKVLQRHGRQGEAVRNGDYTSVNVKYVRKRGLPGRCYPLGGSIVQCPRWAKDAAFTTYEGASGGDDLIFAEVDCDNSLPQALNNELKEYIGDDEGDEFDVISTSTGNYKEWRMFLVIVIYLCIFRFWHQ